MIQQQFIAITRLDGSLSIMGFLTEGRGSVLPVGASWKDEAGGWFTRPATDENITLEIARAIPEGVTSWRRISPAELPSDREFRNAWRDEGAAIGHDMAKARELRLAKLRRERVGQLEQLDRDWMRAMGQKRSADADDIEAQRQALRDMPTRVQPLLDAAQTVEELKAVQ